MDYYEHTSWTNLQECEEFWPNDPSWRPETVEINSWIYLPFQASNKELREKKDGVKEDCGELKIVLKQQNYRVV